MLAEYERITPLLELPLGPLLLLSALFPRNPRARLLLFMSLLPMRSPYDLLPLYLVPTTGIQMIALIILTWLDPIGRLGAGAGYNWAQMVNSYHVYALCILLYSEQDRILLSCSRIKSASSRMAERASRRLGRGTECLFLSGELGELNRSVFHSRLVDWRDRDDQSRLLRLRPWSSTTRMLMTMAHLLNLEKWPDHETKVLRELVTGGDRLSACRMVLFSRCKRRL